MEQMDEAVRREVDELREEAVGKMLSDGMGEAEADERVRLGWGADFACPVGEVVASPFRELGAAEIDRHVQAVREACWQWPGVDGRE